LKVNSIRKKWLKTLLICQKKTFLCILEVELNALQVGLSSSKTQLSGLSNK
jgi:hypothetical protein